MDEGVIGFDREHFDELVRDALLHLDDAAYLQTHPLAQRVGNVESASGPLRGKRLLKLLLDTIESLRPDSGTSSESRAWRTFRLLELRYIEGYSVDEVRGELAISKTQYQRDHTRALEAVGSVLIERWGLPQAESPLARSPNLVDEAARELIALREAEQLSAHVTPEYVDLSEMLAGILAVFRQVCAENHTDVSLETHPAPPRIYGARIVLRQIFLTLFNTALEHASGGTVHVALDLAGPTDVVRFQATSASNQTSLRDWGGRRSPELDVAERLLETVGGKLAIGYNQPARSWSASVTLPVADRPVLLVLDNHPDFIHLVARYLTETGWQVIGAQDVRQAAILAFERRPTAILLDVMIPGQDGWDLLLALKSRPETSDIPVIVCSVLHEPQVARALGAVGYLPKPVSQTALLETLDRWREGTREPAKSC